MQKRFKYDNENTQNENKNGIEKVFLQFITTLH
jgi:hypothetical protein